jgi:AraC-like DNA-binding protein
MTIQQFESQLDRATFRRTAMFGGVDMMSARFVHHRFAPHCHDELMIGMIHAGVKTFRFGKNKQIAAAGSLSVVNPGEMHTGEREHGPELAYAAIYVPKSAIEAMSLPCTSAVRRPVVEDPEIWKILTRACRTAMEGLEQSAAEEALASGMAMLFQRHGSSETFQSDTACPSTVRRAMDYMQSCAGEAISLEDVSRLVGVGLFHLIRLFKKHIGLTPHAYLTQVRIEKSRQLLQHNTSISKVALDLGFADQAHFTKRFKQLTGTTPAHYSKSFQ